MTPDQYKEEFNSFELDWHYYFEQVLLWLAHGFVFGIGFGLSVGFLRLVGLV